MEGSSTFLECVPRSLQARVLWTYQHSPDAPQREVGAGVWRWGGVSLHPPPCPDLPLVPQVQPDERVVWTERGLLVRSVQRSDAGLYLCRATEHGFTQPLLRLALEVITASRVAVPPPPGAPAPSRTLWYRDFLQLLERPEAACEGPRGGSRAPRTQAGPPARPGEEPRAARRRRTRGGPRGPRSASPW